ncbi:MAG TPA: tryptophan synthase subunit alpha [Thermoleophilaceae bacterium]|jgi:tryptophan synthase alpha chain|nr:tryptophan synthase subunit alpha [Thermoleophilaceae bacterium]
MSDSIAAAFAHSGKRAALMPYLMGGHPNLESSRACLGAAIDAGADLIELGIPFSDPLADGPVIHAAGTQALEQGVRPGDVLELCKEASERAPVLLMVYTNIVLAHGGEDFARRAAVAGAAGLIVPDLPHEEAKNVREACAANGLALIPLVAPTTTDGLLAQIGAGATGFVYAVSLVGTTGERGELPPGLPELIERIRGATRVPVAVGFGISTGEQARAVGELADGVIVGSRVVRAAGDGGPDGVREVVADLAGALAL